MTQRERERKKERERVGKERKRERGGGMVRDIKICIDTNWVGGYGKER